MEKNDLKKEKKIWLKVFIGYILYSLTINIISFIKSYSSYPPTSPIKFQYIVILSLLIIGIYYYALFYFAYLKNGIRFLLFYTALMVVGIISTFFMKNYYAALISLPTAFFVYINIRLYKAIKKYKNSREIK